MVSFSLLMLSTEGVFVAVGPSDVDAVSRVDSTVGVPVAVQELYLLP